MRCFVFRISFVYHLLIFSGLYLFLQCIANYALTPEGLILREWDFIHNGIREKVKVPNAHTITRKTKELYERDIFGPIKGYLVITQPNGYSMDVSIDGKEVFSVGDEQIAANIWPRTYMIPINLDGRKHKISIRSYGTYDIGFPFIPYISENPKLKVEIANVLFDKFYLLVGGMALSLSFVLLFLSTSLVNKNTKMIFVYFSLAILFVSMFLIDNTYKDFAGNVKSYLFDRRVNYVLIYLSTLFLYLGIKRKYGKNNGVFTKLITAMMVLIILFILIYPNFHVARFIHKASLFLALIVLFSSVFQCVSAGEIRCIPPFLFFIATFIHDVISYTYSLSQPLFVAYGITVLEFYITWMLIKDYVLMIRKSYRSFVLDSLTGAYSRVILKDIEITENDSVVFVDLDDLKMINDKYGHDKGDKMLEKFVELTKKNVKGQDYVVRYGGDEFLIVLKDCSRENAGKIIRKVQDEFKRELNSSFSYGISSCTEGLQKAIIEADKHMYDMKFNRKEKRGYSGEGSYN